MKQRLLAFLLALAMIASMLVMPASAETAEADVTAQTETCPCGCGKTLDEITWRAWDSNSAPPTSGHYYLDGNYVQDKQKEIMSGDRVVLDLRGNTITSADYGRLLLVYGRFHLLDTVGGGRFMSKVSGGAFGGVVMVSTNETTDAIFELCSGTITIDEDNKGSRRGGLIHLSSTASFRMTGGMLLNGTTVSTANPDTKEPGGCVAAASATSTIEILGGKIVGGESAAQGGNIYSVGTTILKNCEIIGGVAASSGGNIYQTGGSLTMENVIVRDGVTNEDKQSGGNIAVLGNADMTVKDSVIRNGWTAYHGGNIYIGAADVVLENTVIEAGVAKNRGGNIYGATDATGLTIRNCEFPGDVAYLGAGLKLEGKVKIGLLNYGLRLNFGDYNAGIMDASGLTEGSEIYVIAKTVFTDASANMDYFKGSNRTVLTQTEEGISGAYAASGELGGYCPHCGERVIWTAFSTTGSLVKDCYDDGADDTDPACTGRHVESGHYFLGASISSMAQYYIGAYISGVGTVATEDVVIDMAGYSITATGRAFYLRPQDADKNSDSLTILDSYGGSKITGSGAANQSGGVLYNEGGNLTIYGGTYIYKPNSTRNITGGGVVQGGSYFNMYGGTLDGSAFAYTDQSTTDKKYTYNGGALHMGNGNTKHFTMTAGRLIGGTAQRGGCVYFGYNNVVNVTGGQFSGGISDMNSGGGGGCIRVYGESSYKSAKFNMSGASVRDGEVTGTSAGGGNFSIAYGTYNISDCYIEGGKVVGYGGNFTCGTSGVITVTDCIIEGGYSAAQSGNIHMSATSVKTNWIDCMVLNGSATNGGNLNSGNGENIIKGGQYLFGVARTAQGGNIIVSTGNSGATNFTKILANDKGEATLLAGGTAKTYGGNLYTTGTLDLQAASFVNGTAASGGRDIYLTTGSGKRTMTVGAGVTGEISVAFAAALFGEEVYGQAISYTACTELNATMILEGNYNNAILCAKDGKLFVGAIAVTDGNSYTWYTDTASAVAACPADKYVKLFIAQDVVLTKDCAVDLCGQTVNISGAYTLYGMDSSGDGYTQPTGKAVVSADTTVEQDVNVGGKRYITTSDETGYVFHRLENRISGVTLRPSADGIYFNGTFGCDETVSADIASYGVAVSVMDMPGKDFMTDEDTLYTNFDASTLQGGAMVSGVLISGILKDERTAEINSVYGKTPVYATSYLVMKDGTVVLGDGEGNSDDIAYSLASVVSSIDSKILDEPLSYRKYTNTMRAYYTKWAETMADWGLRKINTPADDGVIDVLMIGSSFCYYYVEEMVGLAAAAGIPMRVCNVYYSGCPLEKHYNWWINGEANYQFFDTTLEGGRKQTNNVGLEWCLAQGEWDVISLQQSTSATRNDPNHLETTRLYYTTLLNYLMEQFPDADMMWHQPWSYQIGYDRSGYQMTSFEQQQADMEAVQAYCMAICEEFGIQRVNTGEAWQIVRGEYGYDELCARLGKGDNHEGDFYHDGDIGGGQYLNACVWFEIITGVSPVGNTYAPTYKYNGVTYELDSDITFAELQEAAHKAVQQLREYEAQQ
ncbi:MAG: DUF4886 domain-containing protein [Oscillospiraceae bacterium]|nr:DUF4886 domain-containing protein [Oscillospiraceae bacterium]